MLRHRAYQHSRDISLNRQIKLCLKLSVWGGPPERPHFGAGGINMECIGSGAHRVLVRFTL